MKIKIKVKDIEIEHRTFFHIVDAEGVLKVVKELWKLQKEDLKSRK